MKCFFCALPILTAQAVEHHHPEYKSRGGTTTRPAHKECHRSHHSESNDFREWGWVGGQITAQTRRWALNLRNVRSNPAFETDRAYYRMMYATAN